MYTIVSNRNRKIVYGTYYPMCEHTPWSESRDDAAHYSTQSFADRIAKEITLGGKFGECWAERMS